MIESQAEHTTEDTMSYDDTYSQAGTSRFVSAYGWDALLAALGARYPHRELYSVSMDWQRMPGDIRVMKAKGAKGDLLIRMA